MNPQTRTYFLHVYMSTSRARHLRRDSSRGESRYCSCISEIEVSSSEGETGVEEAV